MLPSATTNGRKENGARSRRSVSQRQPNKAIKLQIKLVRHLPPHPPRQLDLQLIADVRRMRIGLEAREVDHDQIR